MVEKETSLTTLIGTDLNGYTVTKYISSGSFGHVFSAKNNKTNESVALKIPIINKEKDGERWLIEEAKIYNALHKQKSEEDENCGLANIKILSNKTLNKKIMIMDLLGPSLESILCKNKKFTIKSIILIAIQLINTMKYIHDRGYIHRDIKPDNFVIDNKNGEKIYCIDFGLAKKYVKRNNEHISFAKNNKFCGTARYASIAAHKGYTQSRKDDLEAIGYMLIYLFRGKLPWEGIKHKDKKEKYRLILEKKESISDEELCKQLPREFLVFFKYVRNMDFDEVPPYKAFTKMFKKLFDSKNFKNSRLDWVK
jgi:serine/threonine protein kinase